MKDEMYILLFKPIFHKNIFMIFKWITMLFSLSRYNHIARYDNNLVREMKGRGYQEISLDKCLKESNAIVHAYKVIVPIDKKKAIIYNNNMIKRQCI